jgi:hypothetical protein
MRIGLLLILAALVGGCCAVQPQPRSGPLPARIVGAWKSEDGSSLTISAVNPTSKIGSYLEGQEKLKYRIVSSSERVLHLQLSEGGLGMIFDKKTREVSLDRCDRLHVTSHITLNLLPTRVVYTRQ